MKERRCTYLSARSRVSPRLLSCLMVIVLLALLPARFVFAQFESASVLGYIRDNSGAAVPNTTVTLTNQATNVTQTAKSDGDGKYEFTSVLIGKYVVTAESEGFDRARTEPFTVTVAARQRVDVGLHAGSVTQEVTVTSAAELLETETSSRGQVIAEHQVENLPLNGRSYADLALLVPGVHRSFLQNQGTSSREASFNVNGQRSAFNNFLLDGLDNNSYGTSNQGFANENIPPSPDAVSEFRVETNNYSAEYGRASGAVINVSVRRGSNEYHGRAWDYIRNTALNAIGPFPATGGIKPTFIQNQFGGTFGGRIIRDKAFFFADYEGFRQITTSLMTANIPTTAQRAGTLGIPVTNPLTGVVYANGIVPQSAMSAFARNVLAALPTPTSEPAVGAVASSNLVTLPRGQINDDKGDVRVDYTPNQRFAIFGRYSHHLGSIFNPPNITGRAGGNSNGNVHLLNKQIAAGLTYNINSSSIIDARVGFGWNEGGKTPIGVGQASLLTDSGITDGLPTDPTIVRSLNQQSLNGYSQLGAQSSNPQFQNPFVINPKVNYTLLKGINSLKLGYEFQSITTSINDFNPSYGADTYNGKFSALGTALTSSAATQAYALADFMFGLRSNYSLNNFRIIGLQQRMNFMYVQDDIKFSPRLTINAGLRYELGSPQYVDGNHLANFDPATSSLIQATDGSLYNRALVHMPKTNLAPRFGLAYSLDDKTVLRSGFGMTYTQFNREGGENLLAYNGPYIVNASIDQRPTSPACTNDTQDQTLCFRPTQQGYAPNLVSPAAFSPLKAQSRYVPPNNPTGYVESYHLTLQRQIAKDLLLDIGYVGNHGVHLMILGDYNQASIAPTTATCNGAVVSGCPSLQARRPVQNFNTIEIAFGGGSSNYNALQAKIEKRTSFGLYVLNSFTYSRGFDVASGHLETGNGDNSRVNIANIRGDYGPSGYDQPLNNTTSIVYDLPIFRSSTGLTKTLLGGWQFTAINQVNSGLPLNLNYTVASQLSVTGLYTYRPNVSGDAILPAAQRVKTATGLTYLNPAAVSIPTGTNPFGSATRNSLRGPYFLQTDIGLHKAFQLWREGTALDLRAEAFNLINRANYGGPDTNRSNGTFGQIVAGSTTTPSNYPARQVQFAGKIIF